MAEAWIAGFPSDYGGADTELDHLIDLFRLYDVGVTLVPMFGASDAMRQSVLARGCRIVDYRDDVFAGKTVISFCNGQFLDHLPAIIAAGAPAKVIWFNCMTYLFDREREAHARGWIDIFGFVSAYQKSLLAPRLEAIRPFASFPYVPYFHCDRVAWRYKPLQNTYHVGRISRDDAAKFATDTWRIFDRVITPSHLAKKVFILGHGPNASAKIGPPPPGLTWVTWEGGAIPAGRFYATIDTMIHKTGGSRESYCRVLIEAYAHGVVPIVENDYAFPELVIHGETGFLCGSSDEMSYYASFLAMNPKAHAQMARNGRRHLETNLSDPQASWAAWQDVL